MFVKKDRRVTVFFGTEYGTAQSVLTEDLENDEGVCTLCAPFA